MSDEEMSEMKILVELLSNSDSKCIQLDFFGESFRKRIEPSKERDTTEIVQQIIQNALDNWIVDKIIDYSDYDDDIPTGDLTWFLKLLNEDESSRFRNLTDVEKAYLRILRASEKNGRIGAIRASTAIRLLKESGFHVSDVPYIADKTDEFFRTENDEMIPWVRLIPEFELSEEYRESMEEQDRKHWEKQLIMMRAAENDETELDEEKH